VVSSNNFVWDVEGSQVFSGQLVTIGSSGEKFGGLLGFDRLGLSQISQRDNSGVSVRSLGLFQDWHPVFASGNVVLHFARIHVKISHNSNAERIFRGTQREGSLELRGDWSEGPRKSGAQGHDCNQTDHRDNTNIRCLLV
jgi:hypothetical protein